MARGASARVRDSRIRPRLRGGRVDAAFSVIGGLGAAWFTLLLLFNSFTSPKLLVLLIPFWAVTAYLTLPRLHRILTAVYVPDYFIGRTRTSEGMLGDPVNLAADGTAAQIHAAMTAAGWKLADDVTFASSVRIIVASVLRRSYPEAPVSPLMLFGRRQQLAYQQEVEGDPRQRHHVRFWRCPDDWPLPGGRRVGWLGAGSFDTAVGLSLFTLQFTHRIDADIDVERDHIVGTVTAADPAVQVEVLEDFSTGYHHRNGGGDLVRTDGDLPVLDLTAVDAEVLQELPHQVVRAAHGYAIPDGPAASPDPGFEEELETTVAGSTVRRPRSLSLAMSMLVASVLAQVAVIVAALASHRPATLEVIGLPGITLAGGFEGLAPWLLAAGTTAMAVLALLTWVGFQVPRTLLMLLVTVVLALKLVDDHIPEVGVLTIHLLITAVDLVALLALSSTEVRIWSRRGRPSWGAITQWIR
ncbi:LssY C-terminal domain-containing protein [Corynebacterium sp. 335C]